MQTDLIVVGTGSAAQSVAYPCRENGWTVAVVDSRPFGGTCALRGCDPKKVLVGVAEVVDWARRMRGRGVGSPAPTIEWGELIDFKRTFVEEVPSANERAFEEAGIRAFHGRARFVGPTSVQVGGETIEGRYTVIAAGARHAPLGIPGEDLLTTSTGFLELKALPRRIAFVGGGYIAFEFAHIAARAGAEVKVLHRGDRPLERFDPDLTARLLELTRAIGVDVQLGTSVTAVERRGEELVVKGRTGHGDVEVSTDLVVHAAGRVPEIDDLGLEEVGIERSREGVVVNEFLQSVSQPSVYAAGDAVASGGFPLTPVAGMQGNIVAHNLLHGNSRTPSYEGIPSVVFTTPPLARVGLDETSAQAEGLEFEIKQEDTSGWYSSRRVALAPTGFKTLVEKGTGRILGAHILGQHAEEVINIFGLAIRHGLTASQLLDMVYAYPTSGSDITYMV